MTVVMPGAIGGGSRRARPAAPAFPVLDAAVAESVGSLMQELSRG